MIAQFGRLVLFGALLAAGPGAAAPATPAGAAPASATGEPVVVEMFLSQACRESPPAAALAAELSQRPDVLALTLHIDYWNVILNRRTGRWRDPFSDSEFAARQRAYNLAIRNKAAVFTPQAIVGGITEERGADRGALERKIESARREPARASVSVRRAGSGIVASVKPNGAERAEIYLVEFVPHAVTEVSAGDNAGIRFDERNVVRRIARIGEVAGKAVEVEAPTPPEDQGCAILVQASGQGRILAAARCP